MRICLTENSKPGIWTEVEPGLTFAQAVWLSPLVKTASLCGGLGLCGRCAMRFLNDAPEPCEDEKNFFTMEEIANGWRLGCRHIAQRGDKQIFLRLPKGTLKETGNNPKPQAQKSDELFFLGVDLGTTSIEWRAFNKDNSHAASGKILNPQAGAGADVIARLAFAKRAEGRRKLSSLALKALDDIIIALRSDGINPSRMCVAANTAMTEILLDKDISGLCAAPYSLSWHGGEIVGLPLPSGNLPCVFPPLPAPFAGGDLSCGLLAALRSSPLPMLLADLGTNAELALLLPQNKLYIASVPLGPAMEGIGPACGQAAGPGITVAFSLSPKGLMPSRLPGNGKGISATGYLSLLARLLELGIMDGHGHFCQPRHYIMPLAKKAAENLGQRHGEPTFFLEDGLCLTANDVEMLLKVRAAFSVAIRKLVATAGITFQQLAIFRLTGALAAYGNKEDMAALGFIPGQLAAKTAISANLSLDGACILVQDPDKTACLQELCSGAHILQLVDDPQFLDEYMAAMTWK